MESQLLNRLYVKYNIANLSFGIIHDKLGDLYEEYCVLILMNKQLLIDYKNHLTNESTDYVIFKNLLDKFNLSNINEVESIEATNTIPHRASRGLSKTDIIVTFVFGNNKKQQIAISCKQSTVKKVAFAEFDVETICREVGISDKRLKLLLTKHQTDASAKNFTKEESFDLNRLLEPYRKKLVRWVVTGTTDEHSLDLVYPQLIVKFDLKKPKDRFEIKVVDGEFSLQSFKIYSVEEYVNSIMLNKAGNLKPGGFHTGLSWTYATGSKGKKIQFKG